MAASVIESLSISKLLIASHMPMVTYLTNILVPDTALFSYPVAGLCWIKPSIGKIPAVIFEKHWVNEQRVNNDV